MICSKGILHVQPWEHLCPLVSKVNSHIFTKKRRLLSIYIANRSLHLFHSNHLGWASLAHYLHGSNLMSSVLQHLFSRTKWDWMEISSEAQTLPWARQWYEPFFPFFSLFKSIWTFGEAQNKGIDKQRGSNLRPLGTRAQISC